MTPQVGHGEWELESVHQDEQEISGNFEGKIVMRVKEKIGTEC